MGLIVAGEGEEPEGEECEVALPSRFVVGDCLVD